MLHLAGVLGRSSKIRSFDARFAPGGALVRRYREIYRPTPPARAKPDGHSIQLRARETSRALRQRPARPLATPAAAQSATRYGGSSISHALRRRPARLCATPAATQTASRYRRGLHDNALRRRQPTQKRGRCQSNGPAQTMRYISLRKRFLISSTLASRGLPGAQASA